MPTEDNIGYGRFTPFKIRDLAAIIDWHLAITAAVLNKYQIYSRLYRYVDLTAGKGYTPDGTRGSAITFLDRAESKLCGIPYRADFIEITQSSINELKRTVDNATIPNHWHSNNIHYHQGDYAQVVPELFPDVNGNELGLVFVDPSGEMPDFHTLNYVARVRPKMEILIYISSTNVKRLYQRTHQDLLDLKNQIGKDYWLFRRPATDDPHKWIFLLGTDTDIFKEYKRIGFYRLDSEEGQKLFLKVLLTKEQHHKLVQPRLIND